MGRPSNSIGYRASSRQPLKMLIVRGQEPGRMTETIADWWTALAAVIRGWTPGRRPRPVGRLMVNASLSQG